MSRRVRNPKIESRAARARLKPSPKPTFFDLGGKLHLGYRRGKGAGRWVMRVYLGGERYAEKTLGEADDLADANGATVLNFDQAQRLARACAGELETSVKGPAVTVAAAVEAYIASRETRSDALSKLRHVLKDKALASTPLAALTADALAGWCERLAFTMGPSSVRRVASDLRAALNTAAKRLRAELPPTLAQTIKDGLSSPRGASTSASAREHQVLSDADVKRLIDAALQIDAEQGWDGDLARMVIVLAETGSRFGQVARLRVADLQAAERRLMMPVSRKGRGAKTSSHIPVPLRDDVVARLKPAAAGRLGTDVLLTRPLWRRTSGPAGTFVYEKYARGPWAAAARLRLPWAAILERAGLPRELVPYCLRHSSIIRQLRAGLPVSLVSRLHDTSAAMIEATYGRAAADPLAELARSALVPLAPAPVTPLRVVEG